MPACVACGENDFELVDGLYFCTTCQTQTQEMQEIVQDEDIIDPSLVRSLVKTKEQRPQETKTKQKKDVGRPWSVYEGFQYIIQKQLDALIKLGANKELKDIVFRLWVAYLNKAGVAFCKKSELKEPTKLHRQRELFPGTVDKPVVKPKKYRRTYYKHFSKSYKIVESQHSTQNLLSQLSQEKFYDEDQPANNEIASDDSDYSLLESDRSSSVEEDEDTDDSFIRPVMKLTESAVKRKHKKEQMTMLKTICLCYVGLMYTNNLTMPSDIIRWIKEHKIPYLNASSYFPDYMKLYSTDYFTYRSTVPKLKAFQEQVGKWCKLLDLDTFPPVCMTSLIAKYMRMLHLPGELVGIVSSLVAHTAPTFKYFTNFKVQITLPNFEAAAMSFIILTLKIIFGLDDHLERLLSEYGRSLQKLKPSEAEPFFIFDDWASCLSKEFSCGKYHVTVEDGKLDEIRDINGCLLSLYHDSIQSSRFSETRDKRRRINKLLTRINLQKPFLELGSNMLSDQDKTFLKKVSLENVSYNSSSPQEGEDSFSLDDSHVTQHSNDATDDLLDSKSLTSTIESFSKKSVKYIINPHSVLDDFDDSVLSDYTIYSSLVEDSHDSDSNSDNESHRYELSLPALSQHRDLRTSKRKRKLPVTKQVVRKRLKMRDSNVKIDVKKLKETVTQFIDTQENYAVYTQCQNSADRSRSLHWLLNIMSSLICSSVDDLEDELSQWEAMYFPNSASWSKNIGKRLCKFKKNYRLHNKSDNW